jgi:AcrR family transcriptional regulator
MSARPKTTDKSIRAAARSLLETDGIENLSMQAVADAVGVRAPSLYKRFANKQDLLRALTLDALAELQTAVEQGIQPSAPIANLERMASAYRNFAKQNPRIYRLIFAERQTGESDPVELQARLAAAGALLRILQETLGPEKALMGARTLVAFLHGFLLMEMDGLFQFGGDVDAAFAFGMATILRALLEDHVSTGSL